MPAIVPTNTTIAEVARIVRRGWELRGELGKLSGEADPERASRQFVQTVVELRNGAMVLNLGNMPIDSSPHLHFVIAVARAYERDSRKGDEKAVLESMLFKHYPVERSAEAYKVRDSLFHISETLGDSGTDFLNLMIETLDDMYDAKAFAAEDGLSSIEAALLYLTESDFELSVTSGDNGFLIREDSYEYNWIVNQMNTIARLDFIAVEGEVS